MKINSYIKKSISRQFIALICFFILLFLFGAAVLTGLQKSTNDGFISNRQKFIDKRALAEEIETHLNNALFNIRGYLAFDNEELRDEVNQEEQDIAVLLKQFKKVAKTDKDSEMYKKLVSFNEYIFDDAFPKAVAFHEAGNTDKVKAIANGGATAKINNLKKELIAYKKYLDTKLTEVVTNLETDNSKLQFYFFLYSVLLLVIVYIIGRMMVLKIGKPLTDFAVAANVIAKGEDAEIQVEANRKDELGTLSVAFSKMYKKIQEKEQDLVAQNEELIAQQEELHAQQSELEEALEKVKHNEETLYRRNHLINSLSHSFNKQQLLNSIITNMCELISADRGIIVLTDKDAFAAFGISTTGADQFKTFLFEGMYFRLLEQKSPFIIKRELEISEKAYHIENGYVYDLYIPIFSSTDEIAAIMMFSRFSDRFSEFQMDEFSALAKQIGLSLDTIKLFEETERAKELNQDILNNVQEGIQLVGTNGETLQVNTKFCEMFAQDKNWHDFVGKSWDVWTKQIEATFGDDCSLLAYIKDSLQNRLEQSFTYQFQETGKVMKVYAEDLYRNETVKVGTVFVYRDMTKEYEVDKMKSEFVSTVSHELRTPLASILGFTELLINRELKKERQLKYLSTIYGEANRLTLLINDFLDVQRMEAGKQTYEKKYLEVLSILRKIVDNQKVNAIKHKITIKSDLNQAIILGDKLKIEQAFTNIIGNAIKYSPEGGTIQISIYEETETLNVSVKDEGLGIPEGESAKLFNKFYRIDNSDRRKIGGTGLGLAIVQEIVNAHGGKITVQSQLGVGSNFTLSFPKLSMEVQTSNNKEYTQGKVSYRIAVVEDDYSLAELITQELKDFGFEVHYYKSGQEALKAINEYIPDAIVLDIMLEEDDINGWNIMKRLKQRKETKDVPIVISTALDEKEKGYALGAMDYLVKPYRTSELSRTIMQTLLKMGKKGQVLIPHTEDDQATDTK
ncbi:ATP-binding protein [Niallia nealsonii]|uniref:histidine kinase n=1 Tax=Niallia nealsonii TaxID=115979 RepID=A0A2N0Z7B8_9BACI|nr:ATP-binding protein [Niallia nealsonii]PKG25383.1 histidine kinase [Niallia nealsonii]